MVLLYRAATTCSGVRTSGSESLIFSRERETWRLWRLASLLSICLPAIVLPLAAAVSAISAAGAVFFGPGFVDIQSPAVHVTAVESRNGVLPLTVVPHFHECEASGLS